jgi:hypothetical protein
MFTKNSTSSTNIRRPVNHLTPIDTKLVSHTIYKMGSQAYINTKIHISEALMVPLEHHHLVLSLEEVPHQLSVPQALGETAQS